MRCQHYFYLILVLFTLVCLSLLVFQKPALAAWVVDTDPPPCTLAFNPVSPEAINTNIVVTVSSTDNTAHMFSLTGSPSLNPPATITPTLPFTYNWLPNAPGSYVLTATITDPGGNIGQCNSTLSTVTPLPQPTVYVIRALEPWLQTNSGDVHSNQ